MRERDGALDAVSRSLAAASAGRGNALFLLGEAGLGKTSLIERASALAVPDFEIATARGERMETSVPFGLAVQAFASLDAPTEVSRVDLTPSVEPGAPYQRVLRWLQERRGRPLLLVLDDLHWADADSVKLFAFLIRRLAGAPISLIASLRPWPVDVLGIARELEAEDHAAIEQLSALSRPAVAALIREQVAPPVSETLLERIWELCGGNPLLVEQVGLAIERGEVVPDVGAAARGVTTSLLLARFAGLDPASMSCARAASALGNSFRPDIAVEAAELDGRTADAAVEAMVKSGIFRQVDDRRIGFVHPLLAQAMYEDLGPALRQRLHARIFRILAERGLDAEAAEHAVRADLVGDARAIGVLERAGRTSLAAGAVASAVHQLEAAVRLSGDRPDLSLRLTFATALSAAGRRDEAGEICRQLLLEPCLEPPARVETLRLLGQSLYLAGAGDHGEQALLEAVEVATASDPSLAVQPLLDQAMSAWLATGPSRALPLAARARELAATADPDLRERADAAWGYLALESGDPAGLVAAAGAARHLDVLTDTRPPNPADLTWPWSALYNFAMTANYAERFDDAERAFLVARDALKRAGATNALAMLAIYMSNLLLRRGRLREALAEARSVEEITGVVVPYARLMEAEVLLWLGDVTSSEALCREVGEMAGDQWFARVWLSHIDGQRMLWEGDERASDVLQIAEQETREAGIREPCHVHWAAHAVQAHVAAARWADAQRVIDWLDDCAARLPCRWPRFAAALGRASLAEGTGRADDAEEAYLSSLVLIEHAGLPLQRVEGLLAYGGFLRRRGRLAEARTPLGEALRAAEGLEARWLAKAAAMEFRLAGGRRRRGTDEPGGLSEAEQRVADLAATGLSNADIARRLHVSVNTVGTHLRRIYAKLHIGSRRQLMTRGSRTPAS